MSAESEKECAVERERVRREIEDLMHVDVSQAADDHPGERGHHARPQHPRDLADGADAAHQQKDCEQDESDSKAANPVDGDAAS